jgi:sigma-54 dependent transcriptional regulator, acetoin dehydrogenase operon transcriptional activator AcoR
MRWPIVHQPDLVHMPSLLPLRADQRLHQIADARRAVMLEGGSPGVGLAEPWIERSWRRCLAGGHRPGQAIAFDLIPAEALRRTEEANHALVRAARPVLEKLAHAIAGTRYFAILTNAEGVVVDVSGPVDRRDRRVDLITRIGVDLSEACVGTTAIGAALGELAPVWLHRGEHFFDVNSAYSCAGAPLLGPDGRCAGMLDLTGVDAVERPELKHLVVQSARSIENAMIPTHPAGVLLRLNWSSHADTDGMIGLDADGFVTGANPAARQMVSPLPAGHAAPIHCSELFALPEGMLFDAAARHSLGYARSIEVPLWSGLRLHALAVGSANRAASGRLAGSRDAPQESGSPPLPLRDVETALIRKAVDEAKGNVMKAARMLGVSRATVYRRLGRKNN